MINAYDKLVRPNEAKEFSAEKGQHSASLGIPEESHLNQQNGRCSCHANFDNVTSSAAEAAAVEAIAGTTVNKTVDDAGLQAMPRSAPSSGMYSRLDCQRTGSAGRGVGDTRQEVRQNHYDHFNDPAGTGPEYNSLDHGDRARDQQREMAACEYSHI